MNFNSRARAKARRGIESKRRREEKRARVLCARVSYFTESFSLSLSDSIVRTKEVLLLLLFLCYCSMRRTLLRLRIANKLGGRGQLSLSRCLEEGGILRTRCCCYYSAVWGRAFFLCARARASSSSESRQKRKTQRA